LSIARSCSAGGCSGDNGLGRTVIVATLKQFGLPCQVLCQAKAARQKLDWFVACIIAGVILAGWRLREAATT